MKFSISKLKELRKITGIGIIDCKEALIFSNGNIKNAILFLRKKGKKIYINRYNATTSEGVLMSSVNSNFTVGTIIGISCETDFLSKNKDFLDFSFLLSNHSLLYKNKNSFLNSSFNKFKIEDLIIDKMGVVGEKLILNIFEYLEGKFIIEYTHNNNKISVLVQFSKKFDVLFARDIAMHIAAMNPLSIDCKDFPENILQEEIKIIKNQVIINNKNKSDNLIDKIIKGKLKKFINDNTLLNQTFIKNKKLTIKDYLYSFDKKLNIISFKRINI